VKCDGSNGSPTYAGAACQFATFENLHTQAVFVDDSPPAMASLSGPSTQVNGPASFSFGAVADPTFSHFQCRLVTGGEAQIHDWLTCASGHQEDPAAPGTEGTYKLYVRAVDRSGNASPPSAAAWTVDKIRPETILAPSGPVGPTASTTATFTFTGSADVTGYACTLDGQPLENCQSPRSVHGLAQGAHMFTVAARDDAGNLDASPEIRMWSVDTVLPDTSITGGPEEGSVSASRSATFEFGSGEAATFECQLDGAGWSPCESPRSYHELDEGGHTLQVRARDAAGNVDASPATRTWTVDVPIPALPPASAPSTMGVQATFRHDVSGGRTKVRRLKLAGLPAGATVTVTCASKRKGCAFASKTRHPGGTTVNLTKLFKGRALSAGAVIEIRITAAGYAPDTFRYKTRKGAKPPRGGEVASRVTGQRATS